MRATDCRVVPRSFHATYACQWRRYVYLFPLNKEDAALAGCTLQDIAQRADMLLQPLCGCNTDFHAFARMTPRGANTVCQLHSASATLAYVHNHSSACSQPCNALLVQLVGDRFLRRMVRVLVATVLRECVCAGGAPVSARALVSIAESRDRLGTAPAAPACGLCFAGAGYDGEVPEAALAFSASPFRKCATLL